MTETTDTFVISRFFSKAHEIIAKQEADRRAAELVSARRFNLLALIEPDENKLSDIIADLLDPGGTHGQEGRFLELFLQQLNLGVDAPMCSRILREARTEGHIRFLRRIDILITGNDFAIGIENKVHSSEQHEQVSDYLDFLGSNWPSKSALIYLTPDGRLPDSLSSQKAHELKSDGSLYIWSYSADVVAWLCDCALACKADKVRHFLFDFVAYIHSHFGSEATQ